MRQFEIWWADLPKPAGRRPVLLLSRDDAYSYLNKVVVAEITTTIRETSRSRFRSAGVRPFQALRGELRQFENRFAGIFIAANLKITD